MSDYPETNPPPDPEQDRRDDAIGREHEREMRQVRAEEARVAEDVAALEAVISEAEARAL